jgi:hypothetical protein
MLDEGRKERRVGRKEEPNEKLRGQTEVRTSSEHSVHISLSRKLKQSTSAAAATRKIRALPDAKSRNSSLQCTWSSSSR